MNSEKQVSFKTVVMSKQNFIDSISQFLYATKELSYTQEISEVDLTIGHKTVELSFWIKEPEEAKKVKVIKYEDVA